MTDSIFNKAEAGEYMNANFINYQVQTDRVDKDGPDRKAKYEEAKQLATKYKISGLPTMLFFSPDGDLLDEQVGSLTDVSTFLERVKKAIDPREQYYKLLEQYYNGTKDNLFLIKLITLARALDDRKTLAEIEKQINQK
jgi:thioredoxin-related protein